MRIYTLSGTDIYSHLATEAYFLHNSSENIILLWQSSNSVVCGKHQNIAAEVNFKYCRENNIRIARRLTGGGTVFHDSGNVCFTFIQNHSGKLENTIDYKRFLDPIKNFFNNLGIPVQYSKRHDLMIDNKKISGNAQHVFLKQKRVLHHGTLLFNSDLKKLGTAIKPKDGIEHRGVNSVRSQVTNISQYTNCWPNPGELIEDIHTYFKTRDYSEYKLTNQEIKSIQELRDAKFIQDKWIWDYSPKHTVLRHFRFEEQDYHLKAEIKDGIINKVDILQDKAPVYEELCQLLIGPWRFNCVQKIIGKSKLHPIKKELTYLFF